MKPLFILILFTRFCLSAQVEIKGTVYTSPKFGNGIQAVENAHVILELPSGESEEITTDSSGTYFFEISTVFDSVDLYVTTNHRTKARLQQFSERIQGARRVRLFAGNSKIVVQDFHLQIFWYCDFRMPEFCFYPNSLRLVEDSAAKILSAGAILFLDSLMHQHPELTIELDGHSDPDDESIFRAGVLN